MGNIPPSKSDYGEESERYQDLISIINGYDTLVDDYYESMTLFGSLNPAILGEDIVRSFHDIFFKEKKKKRGAFDSEEREYPSLADEVNEALGVSNTDIGHTVLDLKSVIRNRLSSRDRQSAEYHQRELSFIQKMPFFARRTQLKRLTDETEARSRSRKSTRENVAIFLHQKQEKTKVIGKKVGQIRELLKKAKKLQEVLASYGDYTDRQKVFARSALVHLRIFLDSSEQESKETPGAAKAFDAAFDRAVRSLNSEVILKGIQRDIEHIEIEMEEKAISRRAKLRGVLILLEAMGGNQDGIVEIAERYRELEGEIQAEYERVKGKMVQLKNKISPSEQASEAYQENVDGVAEYVSGGAASSTILRQFNNLIVEMDKLTEEIESHMNIPRKQLAGLAGTAVLPYISMDLDEGTSDSGDDLEKWCRNQITHKYHVTPEEESKLGVLFSRASYESAVAVAKEIDPNVEILPRKEILTAILALGEPMLKEIAQFYEPTLLVTPKNTMREKAKNMDANKKYQNQKDVYTMGGVGSPYRHIRDFPRDRVTVSVVDGAPHMPHILGISSVLSFDKRREEFGKHYAQKGMRLIGFDEYAVLMQRSLREYEKSGTDEVSRDTSNILDYYVNETDSVHCTVTCLDTRDLSESPYVAFGCFLSGDYSQVNFFAFDRAGTSSRLRGRPSVQVMEY